MRRHKCVRSRFIAVNNTDVVTQGRKDYSIVSASAGYILGTLTLIHIPYMPVQPRGDQKCEHVPGSVKCNSDAGRDPSPSPLVGNCHLW